MSAPVPEFGATETAAAEGLLSTLVSIAPSERRRHATVFNYWLSIRGDRPFPPIRDLDPLQISDAGPDSLLLEVIDGGEDAEIRHVGVAIKDGVEAELVSDVPAPSLLACIAEKLPTVVASGQAMAFEEDFAGREGPARCWVTLLPFTKAGSSVDLVYGFVTLGSPEAPGEETLADEAHELAEPVASVTHEDESELVLDDVVETVEPEAQWEVEELESDPEAELVQLEEQEPHPVSEQPESTVDEPQEPVCTSSGSLTGKLAHVRSKADEARLASVRANAALCEGLGAVYDFALDAELEPEDYLKLVEANGLKIQLRSPMTPVVRLAFDGTCDDSTISALEAVLAWALKQDLPRGSLPERIEAEGGIEAILSRLGR